MEDSVQKRLEPEYQNMLSTVRQVFILYMTGKLYWSDYQRNDLLQGYIIA